MKLLLVSLAVFSISVSAFADFTGTWKGTGYVEYSSGAKKDQCVYELGLVESPAVLKLNAFSRKCTGFSWSWTPSTFSIQNGVLTGIEAPDVNGTISARQIVLKYIEKGNKNHFSVTTFNRVADDQIDFRDEIYSLESPEHNAVFSGTFKRE